MKLNLKRMAANVGLALGFLPNHAAFRRALSRPERAQAAVLRNILRANRSCAYGKSFAAINSPREYQDAVPVCSYDDLESWIERMKRGEANVLCSEPVLVFEKTSGSTQAAKFIPYTRTLLREFRRAVGAWLWDLYANVPGLVRGSSYWCITPLARDMETGLANDLEYFGPWSRAMLRRTLAVPPSVGAERNLDDCLEATRRCLLQSPDLAFISVWNPSLLTLLLDGLDGSWPNLRLISCWTDAAAGLALPPLREKFPGVAIQGKGLLATEGVVSIPLLGHEGHCLAVTSHFMEFESAPGKRPWLAHELNRGAEYSVILTTGGGLYRYRLGDRIRVIGFVDQTPLIEFIGREGGISDLRGEKLNPLFVGKIIEQWKHDLHWQGSFAMLAPVGELTPFYTLFVDGNWRDERAGEKLERLICANPHYAYCRKLGQLDHARVFRVGGDAGAHYLRHCESLGQRAGNIKPTCLHQAFGWERVFSVCKY